MESPLLYKIAKPDPSIADYVESFWMLHSTSAEPKSIIVLPDGRIDILFSYSDSDPFEGNLRGLDTEPSYTELDPGRIMFAVSLRLLAVEYLLEGSVSSLLNNGCILPADFWNITKDDLSNFDSFCHKITQKIESLIQSNPDSRKLRLFEQIYASNGSMTVKELSETAGWSSRQINRYFSSQFGLPLKTYCDILRFRASFDHLKEGKLFPEQDFADQAHFIRDVKKFSGVPPKALSQNKNDRFIQFSLLKKQ
ncbi:hypothetical protein CLV94_0345 [Flavobacterium endophyticum]|uniref:HTH araC/xylS-type domain-containing protein n=1 Tax=Flavobacterium endophyticum TaxID=1540163 RepID=A0A495MIY8_9FLAO|nr:AraC family transcriptional regulator [Flavobacterium endophyticum]RKS25315.1 hypothetical protein CLV94_0345 [Flavobacterium endophyticum]